MRRIHPESFRVAKRGTPRRINRQIALTLIRTRQPISRADLARRMGVRRGAVSLIVNELIAERLIFEGAKGEAPRGRKPKFLYIDSRDRCIAAVDIRPSRTYLMLTDLVGRPLVGVVSHPTIADPRRCARDLGRRILRLLAEHRELGRCEGVGVVVPGMVDLAGSRVLFAPRLGWRDVPLRDLLASATALPVHIENSGKACALSLMWASRADTVPPGDIAFVSVSDGLGVGVVVNGELLRGRHNVAGEFAHVPIDVAGAACACGAKGCWEAYVSNFATLARYFGQPIDQAPRRAEATRFTVDDLVARAWGGDRQAVAALEETARYLGLGLASVVNVIDPARIYVGGEITRAWELIEGAVRTALGQRTLSPAAGVEIVVVPAEEYPRLRGAAALVVAPAFAAPVVA
jgi:predicted NBD/HSP70 family sugar kinase